MEHTRRDREPQQVSLTSGGPVTDRSGTIPITCARDRHAHDVTDESLIAGQRTGRYQARCGYLGCAAALTAPIGRPCPECTATSLTATTRPDRRSRHRRPRWLGQLLAGVRGSGTASHR